MQNIRVGLICQLDASDPNSFSGTPYSAMQELRKAGVDVVDLSLKHVPPGKLSILQKIFRKLKYISTEKYIIIREKLNPKYSRQHMLANAKSFSVATKAKIEASDVNVLLAMCSCSVLYQLETDLPVVYATDITSKLINETYDEYIEKSDHYKQATLTIEQDALSRCNYFLPAAQATAESGINDFNLTKEQVQVIEFGAHVVPTSVQPNPDTPSKEQIELCLVAADPIRKRLDFCVEVTEHLANLGWNSSLNYIGPEHPLTENERVNWLGRLLLSNPQDRITHQQTLARSHWFLLPSLAEAYGIAPCEAAHFARPSAVSNVGGLPTVIKNEVTGLVFDKNASAKDYADKISAITLSDYESLSNAAAKRATEALSWAAWASRTKEVIQRCF